MLGSFWRAKISLFRISTSSNHLTDVTLDGRFLDLLVCPRDRLPLSEEATHLFCSKGHRYAVVDGIPIFLLRELEQTHTEGNRALRIAEGSELVSTQRELGPGEIDEFVSAIIAGTNGSLYQHLVGKLQEYPIPVLKLPEGRGKLFLEIGCNWGRWCIAAAKLGYLPVGIDPSLKGIRAARRVAQQLGIVAHYVVADGRCLPFADHTFDQAFSYSTLQHLSKENTRFTLRETYRVLRSRAGCLIQMPNVFGVRCLYHQARRGFRHTHGFEVRYWRPGELVSTFSDILGPSRLFVDGYFTLNPQLSDLRFFPAKYRAIVRISEALRKMSELFPPLAYVADSFYVTSVREP
jgi:SAM-dependent methyltransferase/uncharacterized protein YbaR (Trm112 family)